jgi:hypothetical protein
MTPVGDTDAIHEALDRRAKRRLGFAFQQEADFASQVARAWGAGAGLVMAALVVGLVAMPKALAWHVGVTLVGGFFAGRAHRARQRGLRALRRARAIETEGKAA